MYNLPNIFNIPNMSNIPGMSSMPNMYNMPNMSNMPNIQQINKNLDNDETYYSILGINNSASTDEIKKAYRKLSMEYHPDRNNNNLEKSELFKKITESYKILSNEVERKNYDLSLKFSGNIDIDPAMVMNMFLNPQEINAILNEIKNGPIMKSMFFPDNHSTMQFGNMSTHKDSNHINESNTKPETINKIINITLLEAYNGCKLPISITRWKIENNIKHEQTETIYIDIPKGIDDNELIVLKNKGHIINDSIKGDIEIKINVTNNTNFERIGIDLIYKKSISLKESFCGFSFDLKYIDGREFKINNEAGNVIPPDFRKIIPKLGMNRENDNGKLIIIFNIIYPKQLSIEQIDKLREIL